MKPNSKDTLYYDGHCNLCSKEIRWLQKYQQGQLDLQDIHQQNDNTLPFSKPQMLQQLHLHTKNQQWLIGLDATVRAWSHTPYGWLLKPLRWPLINTISNFCYQYWAKKRYHKKYHCQRCP